MSVPVQHIHTHTHRQMKTHLLTPLPCPQQPTHSGRLTVLAQGSSKGMLTGSASSGFRMGVCLRPLSSDELTDWEWNSQPQTCKHQFEGESWEIKQSCMCVCEKNDYPSKFSVYTDNVIVGWEPHNCTFAVFPVETLIGGLHAFPRADRKGASHLVLYIKSKPMG